MAARRLSSYRFRRRLLWSGIWLGFVLSAVIVGAVFWNTAGTKETFSNEPADVYVAPRAIKLTAADKAAIGAVARRFVRTAVAREHPEQSFELVGPALQGGLTREQWKHGDIPVVYYPVDEARWKFDYATEGEVGLSVLLFPRAGETVRPTVFNMALSPRATEEGWLIMGWSPKGGTPDVMATRVSTPEQAIGAAATVPERYSARASAAWLLLPLAFLGVALLLPVVLVVRDRRGLKRARKRMQSRSSS